ncbi:enoyl-CoA hydratase/isomerase family protein [Effusibacillus lacus]|uniref:Enoyl-CoA hydratase n=1 Tax=Effusibacillus lacus TaxID=1348429 RepID=A0A292YL20_9BACL|nr:enoyl-CoA hydratase/isomerase family protein [Effusibacillus lacus]TCS70642.1 enoyl-CoA hydratase [Effusibacillus lacus]GAX90638.1 enoyl-CoA hydratase [Effusibacillus lacus]
MTVPVMFEASEHIAVIKIHRPEASNAINSRVMESLSALLEQAQEDPDIRIVILTGSGDRSFVSGGDLKEFHDSLHTPEDVYKKWSEMREILYRIATFPKPVIAAINGAARGGGGEVAAACHFRIASSHASIGFVQVKLGISPGWGGAALLSRTIGYQAALRLILSGRIVDPEEALRIGMVDEVAPHAEFWSHVWKFAKEMAAHSPAAVQGILHMLRQSRNLRLEEAMDLESKLCAALWNSEEHQTAIDRFLNRGTK